jgi:hypothetical protein
MAAKLNELFSEFLDGLQPRRRRQRFKFFLQPLEIISVRFTDHQIILTPTQDCLKRLSKKAKDKEAITFFLYYLHDRYCYELLVKTQGFKEVLYNDEIVLFYNDPAKFQEKKDYLSRYCFVKP